MTCSSCRHVRAVTVTQAVRIGRRLVEWTLCVACLSADRRLDLALEQAQRAGV